jgi:Putative prokaryotic signal transducing protein
MSKCIQYWEDTMAAAQFVTVYRSQGMLGAQVIKGKLELAGIPSYLRYEAVGQVLGLTVDGLGMVEVQVPAESVDAALELIREDEDDEEDPEDSHESDEEH